jgi:hypothetical protein
MRATLCCTSSGIPSSRSRKHGRLPAKPRQVMYAARPQIIELTGKESEGARGGG